jgi:hypothetical protein
MSYDPSNPTQVKAKNRRMRRAEAQKQADVKALWSTDVGRRYLWELMSLSGLNKNPFTGRASMTDFACGEMNMGQRILADALEACPDLYIKAMNEAKAATKQEAELSDRPAPETHEEGEVDG